MWVIHNPGLSAYGCGDPRINPERKVDLQVEGHSFMVVSEEDVSIWRQSPRFLEDEKRGIVLVEETNKMPIARPQLPERFKTRNSYDNRTALEIALTPTSEKMDTVQMARINLFKSEDDETDWKEDADITYLRNRHKKMLMAAQWWLTEYVEKPTPVQRKRLAAVKRQLKAISRLG